MKIGAPLSGDPGTRNEVVVLTGYENPQIRASSSASCQDPDATAAAYTRVPIHTTSRQLLSSCMMDYDAITPGCFGIYARVRAYTRAVGTEGGRARREKGATVSSVNLGTDRGGAAAGAPVETGDASAAGGRERRGDKGEEARGPGPCTRL